MQAINYINAINTQGPSYVIGCKLMFPVKIIGTYFEKHKKTRCSVFYLLTLLIFIAILKGAGDIHDMLINFLDYLYSAENYSIMIVIDSMQFITYFKKLSFL